MLSQLDRMYSEFIQFSIAGQLSPGSVAAIIGLVFLLALLYNRLKRR